jgi:hypothetical protein
MKKVLTLISGLVISAALWAQSPDSISYQTVIRDAGNAIFSSGTVGMQISVLQGSASGSSVYTETHTLTTNINGLVSLEIGSGTTTDDFSTIDWSAGPYFIKTETDPTGGTTYTVTGTSQLMSVPYALHAKTAVNAINDQVNDADFDPTNEIELPLGGLEGQVLTINAGTPQWVTTTDPASNIQDSLNLGVTPCQLTAMGFPVDSLYGKTWAGGLIFYFDNVSCTGLVSAPSDQSSNADWGCELSFAGTSHQGDGGCSDAGSANFICNNLTLNTFSDWYLPNITELDLMYKHLHLRGFGGFANNVYWSSSEFDSLDGWAQYFNVPLQYKVYKINMIYVRAVRAF